MRLDSREVNLYFSRWNINHPDHPFSGITFIQDGKHDAPVAKVNIETKELTINVTKAHEAMLYVSIPVSLFLFYVFSHELGHLMYKYTDKSMEEEQFAHIYSCQDCRERMGSLYGSHVLDKLESIKDKIVIS